MATELVYCPEIFMRCIVVNKPQKEKVKEIYKPVLSKYEECINEISQMIEERLAMHPAFRKNKAK